MLKIKCVAKIFGANFKLSLHARKKNLSLSEIVKIYFLLLVWIFGTKSPVRGTTSPPLSPEIPARAAPARTPSVVASIAINLEFANANSALPCDQLVRNNLPVENLSPRPTISFTFSQSLFGGQPSITRIKRSPLNDHPRTSSRKTRTDRWPHLRVRDTKKRIDYARSVWAEPRLSLQSRATHPTWRPLLAFAAFLRAVRSIGLVESIPVKWRV